MSSSSTYTITPSLVDNPRQHLEAWTESVETHARSMWAMHDVTGALTLVMSDATVTVTVTVTTLNPSPNPKPNVRGLRQESGE